MHFYICPYCAPSATAKLFLTKEKGVNCACKKGFFNKERECKKLNYKCKEILECKSCESQFKISLDFLQEQKKKLKEG